MNGGPPQVLIKIITTFLKVAGKQLWDTTKKQPWFIRFICGMGGAVPTMIAAVARAAGAVDVWGGLGVDNVTDIATGVPLIPSIVAGLLIAGCAFVGCVVASTLVYGTHFLHVVAGIVLAALLVMFV